MADITASTALRDYLANYLEGSFYFATLHSANTSITAASTYAASGLDELPTANGYTVGGQALTPVTETAGVIDLPNGLWSTLDGETLTAAGGACIWVNSTDSITGAKLVQLRDASVTGGGTGGSVTFTIVDPITIPTPS